MADLVNTPQLAFPFDIQNGEVLVVEQDGATDRLQNATVALLYERGQRTQIPEFGLPDQALRRGGADMAEIVSAVRRWEPDVDVDIINQAIENGEQIIDVQISAGEGST